MLFLKTEQEIIHEIPRKRNAGYANARTLTSTQLSIMEQLGNNLLEELTQAAETAGENVRNVFTIGRLEGDPFRKEALAQVMLQQAAGGSWRKSRTKGFPHLQIRQEGHGAFRITVIWLSGLRPDRQR